MNRVGASRPAVVEQGRVLVHHHQPPEGRLSVSIYVIRSTMWALIFCGENLSPHLCKTSSKGQWGPGEVCERAPFKVKCYHLKIESQKILLQHYSDLKKKTLCKSPVLDSKPEHCHPNSQRRPRASTAALRLPSMQWWWSVILWIKTWHLHEVSAKSQRWANSCLLWSVTLPCECLK